MSNTVQQLIDKKSNELAAKIAGGQESIYVSPVGVSRGYIVAKALDTAATDGKRPKVLLVTSPLLHRQWAEDFRKASPDTKVVAAQTGSALQTAIADETVDVLLVGRFQLQRAILAPKSFAVTIIDIDGLDKKGFEVVREAVRDVGASTVYAARAQMLPPVANLDMEKLGDLLPATSMATNGLYAHQRQALHSLLKGGPSVLIGASTGKPALREDDLKPG